MHSVICSGLGSLECFVIIKCTKFGQLILRLTSKREGRGSEGRGRGRKGKEKGKGREGRGRERKAFLLL